MAPLVGVYDLPAAPIAAFLVGAILYFILAKAGLQGKTLEISQGEQSEDAAPAEA